jgi:hypothetical protein
MFIPILTALAMARVVARKNSIYSAVANQISRLKNSGTSAVTARKSSLDCWGGGGSYLQINENIKFLSGLSK